MDHNYIWQLTNTTTFGVAAKRARDNDASLHTDQVRAITI